MKIVIFGTGTQGTLYGVRLALAGHAVTLIARHARHARHASQELGALAAEVLALVPSAPMTHWCRLKAAVVAAAAAETGRPASEKRGA